jgi:hypothetical protein
MSETDKNNCIFGETREKDCVVCATNIGLNFVKRH